jgi:hypothetical protein
VEQPFSQPLDALGCTEVRKTEVHTAEPIVPEPIEFGFKMTIEKTKGHKSPGIDHIPAEMFKAGGKTISSVLARAGVQFAGCWLL